MIESVFEIYSIIEINIDGMIPHSFTENSIFVAEEVKIFQLFICGNTLISSVTAANY